MNTNELKSRMLVERSYSSASSTTSSRRSGRRKRRRMKHTVMPLKKRPGRHEMACDVHRVSNLDREEMAQSACFWVAKNPVDSGDPSFKEEVFVNREEEFWDEDASYLIENVRQSRQTDELDSRTDSPSIDARFAEEKTFYGVRKAKVYEEPDVEPFSPLSSPRNQSRLSSLSDDSPSALSSEGTGMRVGWTSDINDSSGPEYAGITDEESEGDRSSRPPRRDLRSINDEWEESMEFYGYRRRQASDKHLHPASSDSYDKSRSRGQPRRGLEPRGGEPSIVAAKDITSFEFNSHVDAYKSETPEYSSRNGFDDSLDSRRNGREVYPGGEIRKAAQRQYNGREIHRSGKTRDADDSVLISRDFYPGGKNRDNVGGSHGRFVSRTSGSSRYGDNGPTSVRGELLPGVRTSTPLQQEFPSSDTELVVQRSYDADVEQSSNYSLPITLQKATTKYYSVDELRKSSETGPSEHIRDEGQNVSSVPGRNNEKLWRGYESQSGVRPREDRFAKTGTLMGPETTAAQKRRNSEPDSRIVATGYELNEHRPRYVPRTGEEFDWRGRENASPVEKFDKRKEQGMTLSENDGPSSNYTWEESKELHGYRSGQANGEHLLFASSDSQNKPRSRGQLHGDPELSDGQRTSTDSQDVTSFVPDYRTDRFVDEKSGYHLKTSFQDTRSSEQFPSPKSRNVYLGGEIRDDRGKENVRPGGEHFQRKEQPETWISKKEDRSMNDGWEESKEFYGYRRRQTDDEYSRPTSGDPYSKPRSKSPRTFHLEPGNDRQRFIQPMDIASLESNRRIDTFEVEKRGFALRNGFENVHHEGHFPKDSQDIYPGGEIQVSGSFVSSGRAVYHGVIQDDPSRDVGIPGEEYVVVKQQLGTLTSGVLDERDSTASRDYVDSQKKTRRSQYLEQTVRGSYDKQTTSELELNGRKAHDSQVDPKFGPSHVEEPNSYDGPRGRHRFISHDVPRSEKTIPLSRSPRAEGNGGQKARFPEITEITTKRLHTKSQRDSFRREARRSDPKLSDDISDVGMKMFKERSLPRKHGRSLTMEGVKDLPKKIKKPGEREQSKSDPEYSGKFLNTTDKRKRKVKTKHVTKTTETTTSNATESCNKNVDELVNVFNTLKSLQKATNGNENNTVTPQQVKKIVKDGRGLEIARGNEGRLSPATSISQKIDEIQHILDSVGKNNQQRSRERPTFKPKEVGQTPAKTQPDRKDSYQSSEDSRSTRSSLSYNESAKSSDYSNAMNDKLYTPRERYITREKNETRKKHMWRQDHHGETPWKPDFVAQPSEVVTNKESFSVESYYESTPDNSFRKSYLGPSKQPHVSGNNRPWLQTDGYRAGSTPFSTDSSPYVDDKRFVNVRASRDDNDETYRRQLRKRRELKWKSHSSRGKDFSKAHSDGEVEGFKRLNYNRRITPGTPVNIRLYGLNLEKTCLDTARDVDWEQFREREIPVDEDISRSEIQKPGVEALLGEEPRQGGTNIERSKLRPGVGIKWSHPPAFKVRKDEPQRSPTKETRPHQKTTKGKRVESVGSPELESNYRAEDDAQVLHHEIKWSHPPVSKVRPDNVPPDTEMEESHSAKKSTKADIPEAMNVKTKTSSKLLEETEKVEQRSDVSHVPVRRNISIRSIKRETSDNQVTRTPIRTEKSSSRKGAPEKRPSEKYPSEDHPSEECPTDDISQELLVLKQGQILNDKTPEERPTEIQYPDTYPGATDQLMIERMDISDDVLNDAPPEIPRNAAGVRSSSPKEKAEFSEREREKMVHENTSQVDLKESSSSDKHESTTRTDHTIYTTRTTRTTRTTTETVVKNVRRSDSEPSKSKDLTSESVEPDGKTRRSNDASLVSHEYIEVNADTGRPVNLTMLGRVVEDDAEYLSSPSREDLFLHTRLKMVTEKKLKRLEKRSLEDVDAHLGGPTTAEQAIDDVNHEGELTDSEHESDLCIDTAPNVSELDESVGVSRVRQRTEEKPREDSGVNDDVTEQLLIPISSIKDDRYREDESAEKMEVDKKDVHALPSEDTSSLNILNTKTVLDEQISRTSHTVNDVMSEISTQDFFVELFTPVRIEEMEVEAKSIPVTELPSLVGLKDKNGGETMETYSKSNEPEDFLDFGELTVPEDVKEEIPRGINKDGGIVFPPVDECVTSRAVPNVEATIPDFDLLFSKKNVTEQGEKVSKESVQAPLLPEFQCQPVEEKMSSEKRDFEIPDFQVAEPEHKIPQPALVDETICPSKPVRKDDIPSFQEAEPEIREPRSPTQVDENIVPQETVPSDQAILDFQEVVPELEEPPVPSLLDESDPLAEKLKNELDSTDFQEVVPEFQVVRSAPLNDEDVSIEENDVREPEIQDFQQVAPEYQELRPTPVVEESESPLEKDEQNADIPDFQEAVPEPPRVLVVTESDNEVETPASGSQSMSRETEPLTFVDIEIIKENVDVDDDASNRIPTSNETTKGVEYFEVPRKLPEPEKRLEEEVSSETRSFESITIEKTLRKNVHFVSEIPVNKKRAEIPRKAKGISIANSLQVKDFSDSISESSSETSLQSSSFSSADVSSEMDVSLDGANRDDATETIEMEKITSVANSARKRRNRRGNRFDNVKRSGSLVPESVVSKTVEPEPESLESATPSPHAPKVTVPRSNVPESRIPDHQGSGAKTPDIVVSTASSLPLARETPSRLRPELYLMNSDSSDTESTNVGKLPEKTEVVVDEAYITEEKPEETETLQGKPEPEEFQEEDAVNFGGNGKLADVEQEILPEKAEELPAEEPTQLHEKKTEEQLQKELEDVIEDEFDELSPELLDELLEKEIQGLPQKEFNDEEIEKAPEEKSDQMFEEKTRESQEEEINEEPKEEGKPEGIVGNETVDEKLVEELEISPEEAEPLHETKPEVLLEGKGVELPEGEVEKSVEEEREARAEDEPIELSEQIEKSSHEEIERDDKLPREAKESIEKETKQFPEEETEKAFEEESEESSEEQPSESSKEWIGKYPEEAEDLPGKEPDELLEEKPEKSVEEHLLATHQEREKEPEELGKGTEVCDLGDLPGTTVLLKEIPIKVSDNLTKEDDDQTPSSDNETAGNRTEISGGVSVREESTVETIIVQKTYSQVSTTVTETITTRLPSDPTASSSEDEGYCVQIPFDNLLESQEGAKPCIVNVVNVIESEPCDEIMETDEEKPRIDEGSVVIPVQVGKTETDLDVVVMKGSGDEVDSSESQPILIRTSEEETYHYGTSSKDSEEKGEIVENVSDEYVTSASRPDDKIPTETVFGIIDIKYDEPVSHDDVSIESSLLIEGTAKLTELPLQVVKIRDISESEESDSSESDEESPKVFKYFTDDRNEGLTIPGEVISSEVCEVVSAVPTLERRFEGPEPEVVLPPEDLPTPEDVPAFESVLMEKEDGLNSAITTRDEEIDERKDRGDATIYGAADSTKIKTRECESQTESEMYSETTQTEETTKITQETSSMTEELNNATSSFARRESVEHDVFEENTEEYRTISPKSVSMLIDSEMQTEAVVCDVTTQTDTRPSFQFESSTQWFSYKRRTEETTEFSEEVGTVDDQTQTDVRYDDAGSETIFRDTAECTSVANGWGGIARSNMGTQTEDREGEGSISNETEITRTVCRTTLETRSESSHLERVETITQDSSSDNFKSDCPVCLQSLESTQYSYIKVSDLSRFVAMQDFASQTEFHDNVTDEKYAFCISRGRRQSTEGPLESGEPLRTTTDEWEQDVAVQRESSFATSKEAHLTIHIEGDEKCSLFCRRVGNHTCMLQKLASIIKASRRTTADSGATTSSSAEKNSESSATIQEVTEEGDGVETREDSSENGASVVIGGPCCDVSVQTEGVILPTDFEEFSEKDFEIYYDGQSSPYWTAMTIAQGMQNEHESLMKQLDLLREVNQKLRDQKDAMEAAHEATVERSPTKSHQPVTRQGSEMSKYFGTFEGSSPLTRTSFRLTSVDELDESRLSSTPVKRKLHRTSQSTTSMQSPVPSDHFVAFDEADGAEFESDRVFEEGELKESERPEWMEKVHAAVEPLMSEAQRKKAERDFREHKKNMVPRLIVEEDSSHKSLISDDEELPRKSPEGPLSPRKAPVGTETESKNEHNSFLVPEVNSNLQRVYKVVLVGDSGVGKSSFIHRYCYEIWKPSYTATIGVDFQVKSLQIDGKRLALQLWDTAGQERFRSITQQYFRKADGVVLLYDLTSQASYVNIKSWMVSVEEAAEPGCTVMLVGNKLDLCQENEKYRAVEFTEGKKLAEEYDVLYSEASAKTGENVNESMEILARALQEQEDWQLHSVLNLKLHDTTKKKKSCCGR